MEGCKLNDIFPFLSNCRGLIRRSVNPLKMRQHVRSQRRAVVDKMWFPYLEGYNAALESEPAEVAALLQELPYDVRAVMYEGAYTAFAAKDILEDEGWNRLKALSIDVPEKIPVMFQGIGGALSQLQVSPEIYRSITESFYGWMSLDSYGCHEGYFRWNQAIQRQKVPHGLTALGQRAFDQGIGRAIWLIGVADPTFIANLISEFPLERRADLWSGVGLMVGYWGAVDSTDMRKFRKFSRKWRSHLQQGVALATHVRVEAQSVPDYTEGACEVICDADYGEVASLAGYCINSLGEPLTTSKLFLKWKMDITNTFSCN